jgi:hypothetical protein
MICEICQQPTKIGDAYLLPRVTQTPQGDWVNLIACSAEHRREWLNRNPDDDESPRDANGECS